MKAKGADFAEVLIPDVTLSVILFDAKENDFLTPLHFVFSAYDTLKKLKGDSHDAVPFLLPHSALFHF